MRIEYRAPLTYRAAPVEVDMWVTRVHGAGFDLGAGLFDATGESQRINEQRVPEPQFHSPPKV